MVAMKVKRIMTHVRRERREKLIPSRMHIANDGFAHVTTQSETHGIEGVTRSSTLSNAFDSQPNSQARWRA